MSKGKTRALIDLADKLFQKGEFKQALRSYGEILKNHRDISSDIQVSLFDRVVTCLYKTEQYSRAQDEIGRFEKLLRRGSVAYAKLQVLKADVCIDMGDYDEALENGKAAFEVLRTTNEDEMVLRLHRILGLAYFSKGDLEKAKICFEDVLSTCRRTGDTQGLLVSFNGLAQVYLFAGKWARALEYWEQGLRMSKSVGRKEWTAAFSLNLGTLHRKLGNWSLASTYLRSGIRSSKDLKHILDIIRGQISLAFLYRLQRQWNQAIRLLERCRELCEKEGYKRELYLCLEGLGGIASDRCDYDKATQYYSNARKIADGSAPEGDMAVEIYRRLADLSVALDNPGEALRHASSALDVAKKLGDDFEEACTHRACALAYQKLGELSKAEESFSQAIELLEKLDERYERARTLLEFGKFLGGIDRGDEAIHAFLKAEELFGKLPSRYWMGTTYLEAAKTRLDKGGTDLAIISLDKAAKLFEESSEREGVEKCSEFRQLVEKRMVETSLRANHETAVDGSEEDFLEFLVKRIGAARAFVVVRENGDFEVKATHGIGMGSVRRLLEVFNSQELTTPVISTNLESNERFPLAERNGIRSFVLIPFGPEKERGILYLDRMIPFTQKDLTLSVRLASNLALKMTQTRHEELKRENLKLKRELERRGYPQIVTRDKKMLEVLDLADRVKNHPIPVLIEGETGTGKELIARAIHELSHRKGDFIVVNCAGIPENLLESELFGYKKGAFTGATGDRKGKFEAAHRGTIFLDEICGMSLRMQHKVLRVLEFGQVTRLGETAERSVDVRVISATNIDLEEEVKRGNFRAELYFRLRGILIELPPLRERKDDIPPLVDYFVKTYTGPRSVKGISPQALRILFDHDWPGNVRELRRVIETAIALSDEDRQITPAVLRISGEKRKSPADAEQILKALKENSWVKRKAARTLGIPESTLRRKVKKLGLAVPVNDA